MHRKNIHRPQPLAGGARPKSTAVCPTLQLRSIKVHHEALKAFLKAFLKNKNKNKNNKNKNKNNNDNNDNNDNDHGCCFPVSQGFETCAVWAFQLGADSLSRKVASNTLWCHALSFFQGTIC